MLVMLSGLSLFRFTRGSPEEAQAPEAPPVFAWRALLDYSLPFGICAVHTCTDRLNRNGLQSYLLPTYNIPCGLRPREVGKCFSRRQCHVLMFGISVIAPDQMQASGGDGTHHGRTDSDLTNQKVLPCSRDLEPQLVHELVLHDRDPGTCVSLVEIPRV